MKKLLISLLTLLLVLGMTCAAAEPTYRSGNYQYAMLTSSTVKIFKYTGTADTLEIPAQLNGFKVTAIGDKAFFSRRALTSVTIPAISFTSLPVYAPLLNAQPLMLVTVPFLDLFSVSKFSRLLVKYLKLLPYSK